MAGAAGCRLGLAVVFLLKNKLRHAVLVEMPSRSAKDMARPVRVRLSESADANFAPIRGNTRLGKPVGERLRISMEEGK